MAVNTLDAFDYTLTGAVGFMACLGLATLILGNEISGSLTLHAMLYGILHIWMQLRDRRHKNEQRA